VRISHLAYGSEIAQAMLRRQQANAVVAARSRIVEGADGMVEMAVERLSERGIVRATRGQNRTIREWRVAHASRLRVDQRHSGR